MAENGCIENWELQETLVDDATPDANRAHGAMSVMLLSVLVKNRYCNYIFLYC